MSDDDLMPEIEATGARLVRAREMIGRRIIGQTGVVEQTLIAILSGGHGLLVGAPGLAKTRLVETLGTVLGLLANRVQFTPDLMPADILGAEVLETGADWVRGLARLISSAIKSWQKIGPSMKRNARVPSAPVSSTSAPRMSAGIRSGVN